MAYDMSSWDRMAEDDPSITIDKENGIIKRRDEKDGTTFEFDPISGKAVLYKDNGEYWRDANDYDHGWIYKKPGMEYGQIRRKNITVFFDRLIAILWASYIMFFPAALLTGISNRWVAVPLVVGWLSLAIIIINTKLFKSRSGQHLWYGRLYKN